MLGFDKICFNFMNACSPDFDQMNSLFFFVKSIKGLMVSAEFGTKCKPNICITSVTFFWVGNS